MPDVCFNLRPSRHRSRGFTLLELIAVMLVIAVAFAAAAPMLGSFVRGRQADDAAVQLLAVIQWARQHAMLEARPYRLSLSPEAGRYRLQVQGEGGQFVNVEHDFGQVFRSPNGVELAWQDAELDWERGHNGVMFWTDGTVDPVAIRITTTDGSDAGGAWVVQCSSPSEPFVITRGEGGQP